MNSPSRYSKATLSDAAAGHITSPERLLSIAPVVAMTGLSRTSVYVYMQQGLFPKPRKLGLRRVAWLQSEIEGWMRSRETVQ